MTAKAIKRNPLLTDKGTRYTYAGWVRKYNAALKHSGSNLAYHLADAYPDHYNKHMEQMRKRDLGTRQRRLQKELANTPPEQAYQDWLSGRAYVDGNGNYRRRAVTYDGYLTSPTSTAPWNREIKQRFGKDARGHTNVEAFDRAARAYAKKRKLDIPHYKHYGSRTHDPKGRTHRSFV